MPNHAGHFYKQANGQGGAGDTGYAVTNDASVPFWDWYQRLGGPAAVGYPASQRFGWDGFTVQVMQKVVFQWRPESSQVMFVNVLDRLHDLGQDGWLQSYRQTPPPFDTGPDTGLSWADVERRHWAFLDQSPAIKARYLADPDPIDHFGLPVSYADEGTSLVIRAQRAVFQYWKTAVPWAAAGEVTVANAGDLAKEVGLFPVAAVTPGPAPRAPVTHDWRATGFVSAVGGQLFDPGCYSLRSVGTNAPNLAYRNGLSDNLEWLRQHHFRWLRIFATGHALGPDRAPRDASSAIAAVGGLLNQVQAYNAAHDLSEAIYVLVSLTDYYPPGVPGDRYAFDHPVFSQSPVLPAPWFRSGTRQFDFSQEHNQGTLTGLPNYEVNYRPWVEQIVGSLAGSPALLGWQVGNELKARGSPRNNISSTDSYGWYRAFTSDLVDVIRQKDRNHLIFLGAQYTAELTDWEYRPKNQLAPDRVSEYQNLVQQMLGACGVACWNVWSLTSYDFNPYPIDDAATFGAAGVPVVATEYGFTLSDPATMRATYGGDRAVAVRNGFASPWQNLAGQTLPRRWSVADLVAQRSLAGVAPWGSPAPGVDAGLDTDGTRGVTGAPDEAALWAAWGDTAGALESANRAAGPAAACQSYLSR